MLDEEDYEIAGDALVEGAPRASREARSAQVRNIFWQWHIQYYKQQLSRCFFVVSVCVLRKLYMERCVYCHSCLLAQVNNDEGKCARAGKKTLT